MATLRAAGKAIMGSEDQGSLAGDDDRSLSLQPLGVFGVWSDSVLRCRREDVASIRAWTT